MNFANGQCSFENLFPVPNGVSKFTSINSIKLNSNLKEYDQPSYVTGTMDWVESPDYLKGDLVKKSKYFAVYKYHSCFQNWDDSHLYLGFVDDKLYQTILTLNYSSDNFSSLIENYNTVVEILKNKYIYQDHFGLKDNEEQVGEGFEFRPYKEFRSKIESVNIKYEIVYEEKWNISKQVKEKTGKISGYKLQITRINLKGTKLDNRGY